VIMRPFRPRHTGADQAAYTLTATVPLSAFDSRIGIERSIREKAYREFGDEVRAEVPRRAVINEAFQGGTRLGDCHDTIATNLARVFQGFLERDLLGRPASTPPNVQP
nr:hypothetical protein [Mycobacterium ulcerans]MEB3979406.1 hypothetical protein [Mycobacterium ulcerans]MEB4008673.1 hypothetical protein [Mycobacterium ulcerans]MEB4436400.1 hypothetical protein [Mycobacterium ulcerans]